MKSFVSSMSSRIAATIFAAAIMLCAMLVITSVPAKADDIYLDQLVENNVLKEDLFINGSVRLNSDLDLNGHSLTINGDLIHEEGTLSIGYGNLTIEGSYRFVSNRSSILNLNYNNGSTVMTIGGDFLANEFLTLKGPKLPIEEPFWINVGGNIRVITFITAVQTIR